MHKIEEEIFHDDGLDLSGKYITRTAARAFVLQDGKILPHGVNVKPCFWRE